jgi:hypothetical protein
VIVPLPLTNVHNPVPTVGVFAFRVAVVAHTLCGGPATEGVGGELTATFTVAVAVHPVPVIVPVTVYEVLEAGFTLILLVVGPVFQTYVFAPVADNVTPVELQEVTGLPKLIRTEGTGLTVTVFVNVCLYPQTPSTIQV